MSSPPHYFYFIDFFYLFLIFFQTILMRFYSTLPLPKNSEAIFIMMGLNL